MLQLLSFPMLSLRKLVLTSRCSIDCRWQVRRFIGAGHGSVSDEVAAMFRSSAGISLGIVHERQLWI